MDNILKKLILICLNHIKNDAFIDGSTASDEDAFGLLISKYFKWDANSIIKTTLSALEDSNFDKLKNKVYYAWQDELKNYN